MQIKRSISVILTAVLLCMAILMTSCDALSVKKVEEDPTEQLMSSTRLYCDKRRKFNLSPRSGKGCAQKRSFRDLLLKR